MSGEPECPYCVGGLCPEHQPLRGGPKVRALRPEEREHWAAFLEFVRAEPYPKTAEGWIEREALARLRWPGISELFEGWGVDAAAAVRASAERVGAGVVEQIIGRARATEREDERG